MKHAQERLLARALEREAGLNKGDARTVAAQPDCIVQVAYVEPVHTLCFALRNPHKSVEEQLPNVIKEFKITLE